MASKLLFSLKKLRVKGVINKFYNIQKHKNNLYVVDRIINTGIRFAFIPKRTTFKFIKIPFLRLNVPNYISNLKYIETRVIPPKIRFHTKLNVSKYLNKGCSAVICSIDNENGIIAKQAYKFDPYTNTDEMRNENNILDKLQRHPNIIQKVNEKEIVSDICQDPAFADSCPDVEHTGLTNTLILEKMEMNLDVFLKSQEINVVDRIDILSQILEAQVYMNRKSICHRDMKLSNILVKAAPITTHLLYPRRFIIKVADFDCAIDLDSVNPVKFSHSGASICTAPEILNMKTDQPLNLKKLYSKNDIWAIGGMAYEIFGLENPFTKIDAKAYYLEDLPPMESMPDIVQKVVRNLLHPNYASRYQSCVATDILQIFRLKLLIPGEVFRLFEKFSLQMMVAFCYLNNLYFTGYRFLVNPKRMDFVLNYIH